MKEEEMLERNLIATAFGLVALMMNFMPSCSDEESFQFGEEELRAAVEGTWTGEISTDGGTPSMIELEIVESTIQQSKQSLCESRSFFRPAEACVSVTTMSVKVVVSSDNDKLNSREFSGYFEVTGTEFQNGGFQLGIPEKVTFEAMYDESKISGSIAEMTEEGWLSYGSFVVTRKN